MTDFDREVRTSSREETIELAKKAAEECHVPTVICLYGELGSGKTTFVQGFAKALGITSRLLSPTFIIVRRYQIPKKQKVLYHLDLYRMNSTKEVEGIGITEIFSDSHAYVLIEWADKLGSLMPKDRIDVRFTVLEDGKHQLSVKSCHPRE